MSEAQLLAGLLRSLERIQELVALGRERYDADVLVPARGGVSDERIWYETVDDLPGLLDHARTAQSSEMEDGG